MPGMDDETQPQHTRKATRPLPAQTREASFQPSTFNTDANTVEIVISTGARVLRYDFWSDTCYEEELAIASDAIDLARVEAGTMQVLDNHNQYRGVDGVLGRITEGRIEGGLLVGTVALSRNPDKAGIVQDIKDGVLRAVSVGYSVQRYEVTKQEARKDGGSVDLWRAARWTPMEVSFVTVPADAGASTRNQAEAQTAPCEFFYRGNDAAQFGAKKMDENQVKASAEQQAAPANEVRKAPDNQQPAAIDTDALRAEAQAAEQTRAADIIELCQRHNVSHLAAGMIRSGHGIDQARAAVLEELARNDAAAGGHHNVRVQTVQDEGERRMAGIAEAIQNRIDPGAELTENGRQYRGMSLVELGRDMLEGAGVRTRGMSRLQIATQMLHMRSAPGYLATSDFSSLLANVANKRLRDAYQQSQGTYRIWARRAPNAPDFKDIQVTQLSGAPDLLPVNESGEFTYGTLSDGAESYKVVTYGRIVALTRQAIINDDLRGFDRLVRAFGDSSARLENRLVYAQIASNPVMSDTNEVFHSAHANGANNAIDIDNLGTARAAMRAQKGLQGETLNIVPRYLIVPTALEQTAYQYTSTQYVPAQAAHVNEFQSGGRTALEPIVDPVLDTAAAVWYLAADPAQVDTVEYCYLEGAEGPVIEEEIGFEVDGVSLKARLDFAAKVVDYRGLYRGGVALSS